MEQDKRSWRSTQISQFCKKKIWLIWVDCYDKNIPGHGEIWSVMNSLHYIDEYMYWKEALTSGKFSYRWWSKEQGARSWRAAWTSRSASTWRPGSFTAPLSMHIKMFCCVTSGLIKLDTMVSNEERGDLDDWHVNGLQFGDKGDTQVKSQPDRVRRWLNSYHGSRHWVWAPGSLWQDPGWL